MQSAAGCSSKSRRSPPGPERRGDRGSEVVEIPCALRRLGACVDEVEAAAQELGGERVELAVDPEHRGAALARDGERAVRRVDAGDGCAELDELDGRGAGACAEMQDALAFEIRERLAHERRQRRLVALQAPVRGVERAAVLVGGLHAPTIARFSACGAGTDRLRRDWRCGALSGRDRVPGTGKAEARRGGRSRRPRSASARRPSSRRASRGTRPRRRRPPARRGGRPESASCCARSSPRGSESA